MRIPDISNRLFSDRNATLESELETAALNFWFLKKMAHRLAKLRIGDTNPDLSATPLAPVSFIELIISCWTRRMSTREAIPIRRCSLASIDDLPASSFSLGSTLRRNIQRPHPAARRRNREAKEAALSSNHIMRDAWPSALFSSSDGLADRWRRWRQIEAPARAAADHHPKSWFINWEPSSGGDAVLVVVHGADLRTDSPIFHLWIWFRLSLSVKLMIKPLSGSLGPGSYN